MAFYFRYCPEKIWLKYFNRQIEAMLPQLYKLACGLVGKSGDAEDLVHDACVKALTSYSRAHLPNDNACRIWVRSILINSFRDRYRRQQRSPVRSSTGCGYQDIDNVIEFTESSDPSPEDWAVYADLESAIGVAMASLPPEVRIVTTLFMIDEKSYKEIAQIVDCPLGTVMSRLARGRCLLREKLSGFADNDAAKRVQARGAATAGVSKSQ